MQEEVLNRGYMFANLHRLRPLGMLLAASFLFALTHIPTKGLHMYPLLIHFIGGLCYGYVYLKSGSLWISSAVHAAHNWALDLWFNDDYGVSLVSFAVPLTDGTKLLQQALLVLLILVLTYGFYGRNGIWTPADNLNALWTADRHRPHSSGRDSTRFSGIGRHGIVKNRPSVYTGFICTSGRRSLTLWFNPRP